MCGTFFQQHVFFNVPVCKCLCRSIMLVILWYTYMMGCKSCKTTALAQLKEQLVIYVASLILVLIVFWSIIRPFRSILAYPISKVGPWIRCSWERAEKKLRCIIYINLLKRNEIFYTKINEWKLNKLKSHDKVFWRSTLISYVGLRIWWGFARSWKGWK